MAKTHSEAPFTPDRMKLILASAGDGLKAVGMTSMDQAPAVLVHAVDDYVFNWQQGKLAKEKMIDPEDAPFALGTLWGEQLVRQFGWQWATITFHQHKDSKAPAVLSPDRSLFIGPIHYIMGCLQNRGVDICIELSFNMLKAGKINGPKPHEYNNLMEGVAHIVPRA